MTDRFSQIANTNERPIGSEGTRREGFIQGGIPFNPPNCQGITKVGTPCRASRARDTMYCYGHLRSRGEA